MSTPSVKTRFAPSPTGLMHLGNARTALFNWLYAKHTKGTFDLRIEDTDKARSTPQATQHILESLKWLGITWDHPPCFQSHHLKRHQEIAEDLIKKGKAYWCYLTPAEIDHIRSQQKKPDPETLRAWRDKDDLPPPHDKPVLRLKMPKDGSTTLNDAVQGNVTVSHQTLEDLILLRSDGSPTYMLAVVVDDHDMEITHVIRGGDHLSNTFKQIQIYRALGWRTPTFAHIPLIHNMQGQKLSKRRDAVDLMQYANQGILPEAMRNALLRLGWGHGNDEIISDQEAAQKFSLEGIGRSPARFDPQKLEALNAHYLRTKSNDELLQAMQAHMTSPLASETAERLKKGLPGLKVRARTLDDLWEGAQIYMTKEVPKNAEKCPALSEDIQTILPGYLNLLQDIHPWTEKNLEDTTRQFAENHNIKLGKLAGPLRLMLTGRKVSPSLFDVMATLGPKLTLHRLNRT